MISQNIIKKIDFKKMQGIIPCIVQDYVSRQVLMLGFQNKEALEKTIKTKKVTFFSRTKKKLWTKGEESGNFLELKDIKIDCDKDTVLIIANPVGPTCHLGNFSCFGSEEISINFLETLMKVIQKRKKEKKENSYVCKVFDKGKNRIIQKVGEEAVETVIAAMQNNKKKFISESADLIFHFLILCVEKNISLNDIIQELYNRHEKN